VGRPPAGTEGGDYVLHKPSAEERAAIDASIENALGVLPQCIAGDLQGAMQKLHSQDKPAPAPKKEAEQKKEPEKRKEPEKKKEAPKKEAPAKEPEKEKGFLKSLFGKK